jgi:hypothetical protein
MQESFHGFIDEFQFGQRSQQRPHQVIPLQASFLSPHKNGCKASKKLEFFFLFSTLLG